MKVDGQCLCGYLRYEAHVDPATALICNCTDCQTVSGSAFGVTVGVTSSFKFLSGKPRTWLKVADSGNQRALGFCPRCGTSIYSRPVDGARGFFGLRVGPLRQRHKLMPHAQYWARSAQDWIDGIADLPTHQGVSREEAVHRSRKADSQASRPWPVPRGL